MTYSANVTAYALYGAVEMMPESGGNQVSVSCVLLVVEERGDAGYSHFVMIAAKNKLPTRFPNVTAKAKT